MKNYFAGTRSIRSLDLTTRPYTFSTRLFHFYRIPLISHVYFAWFFWMARHGHPIKSLLETNLSEYAIHDVSAVLKELLRHLPEPLFPYKTYHDVIEILQYRQSPLFRLKELNHLIKQLSEVRRYVIGKILYHLAVISSKSNHNRMNSKSLGWFF